MNRAIKFRVWDEVEQCMRMPAEILFGDDGEALTILALIKRGGYDRLLTHGEDGQIIQFTGLHDVDGKEIYEGDIVEYDLTQHDACGSRPPAASIEWNGNGFWITRNDHCFIPEPTEMRIIGNIYENKDLLS